MLRNLLCSALIAVIGSTCLAAAPRGGPEIFLIGHGNSGTEAAISEDGITATLDVDPGFGGGLGIGLNFGPFINLNFSGVYSKTEIEAELDDDFGGGTIKYDKESMFHLSANLEIYPFDAEVTPLIGGGVGVMNISAEQGSTDISETNFAYNFTGGLRWDIDDHWFLKAQYRIIFFEFEDSDDTDPVHAGELSIGWRF